MSDKALVLLADVMAVLASTDNGRHHLLYGQDQPKWTHNKYVAQLESVPLKIKTWHLLERLPKPSHSVYNNNLSGVSP